MCITFLILMWLLPLTACSLQDNNSTNVTTGTEAPGSVFTLNQVASTEASTLNPLSVVLALNVSESVMEDESSLRTGPTSPPPMFLPDNQPTATPTSPPTSSPTQSSNSGTSRTDFSTGSIDATTEPQVATTDVNGQTTTASVPPTMSASTESQSANDTATPPPSYSPESPKFTSTELAQSTSPGTSDEATKSNTLSTTSKTTAKTPFVRVTKAKKRQDPLKNDAESDKASKHGKVVAGIIGGALILMMVGFLVIYIKKRKLQRQKTSTSDWAGPSPFLEGGDDNGGVRLRSSYQISLTSFLPQRLSKRLSMLPDADEDKTPGTTFGLDGNEEESNGAAVVVSDTNGTTDAPKIGETSMASSQTNLLSVDDNPEVADPPNPTAAPENAAE